VRSVEKTLYESMNDRMSLFITKHQRFSLTTLWQLFSRKLSVYYKILCQSRGKCLQLQYNRSLDERAVPLLLTNWSPETDPVAGVSIS